MNEDDGKEVNAAISGEPNYGCENGSTMMNLKFVKWVVKMIE